ncbi:MAG TPA: VOC family protein [Mycobacteriales bacterium]
MSVTAMRAVHLVIDCADLDRITSFWSRLLDLPVAVDSEPDWRDLAPLGTGGPVLSFQRVPDRKQDKNRLHLDFEVADLTRAAARTRALGARPASSVHGADRSRWQVWRDPEGNEFCLCEEGSPAS